MWDYAVALDPAQGEPFWQLPEIMGHERRIHELGNQFNNLYLGDDRMVEMLRKLMGATDTALREVSDALGPAGSASPRNVPRAAALLGEYGNEFRKLERKIKDTSEQIEDAVFDIAKKMRERKLGGTPSS
jgi:hypothetical protein